MAGEPTMFGEFALESLIGQGGMGMVYRARQVALDRWVALKVLAGAKDNKDFIQRFYREARSAARLVHPNVVQIYTVGEHDGVPYFAMEYVDGADLEHACRGDADPFSILEAIEIVRSVAKALTVAAEHGIVHRDIKPANIMIAKSGLVKVMDFGLARGASSDQVATQPGLIVGTPTYMSPEQGLGKAVDSRSDIYSLGCVLYKCLCNRPPFTADDVAALIYKHAYEDPEPPGRLRQGVPPEVEALCLQMLAKKPEDRFQSAEELLRALSKAPSNPAEAEMQLARRVATHAVPPRAPGTEAADGSAGALAEPLSGPATIVQPPTAGSTVTEEATSAQDEALQRILSEIAAAGGGSNFPAVAKFVSDVHSALRSETTSIQKISSLILKDFALTNSLLKLVNSAFYGASAGQRISTISRAVGLLGINTVGNLAISLCVFDSLSGKSHVAHLKKLTIHSLLTGVHARELSRGERGLDPEFAMVTGMMNSLGRMVVGLYFPAQYTEIEKLMVAEGISDDDASARVLGVGYPRIARAVARAWRFPDELSDVIGDGTTSGPITPALRHLRILVSCAGDLSACAALNDPEKRSVFLEEMRRKYGNALPGSADRFDIVLNSAGDRLGDLALTLRIPRRDLELFLPALAHRVAPTSHATAAGGDAATVVRPQTFFDASAVGASQRHLSSASRETLAGHPDAASAERRRDYLAGALDEISHALATDLPLNDVLMMILEAVYQGIGFDHVVLALITPDRTVLKGRFSLGARCDELTAGFQVPLKNTQALPAQVILGPREVLVLDTAKETGIPAGFMVLTRAKSFALFPIVIKNVPIGAIYAQRIEGERTIDDEDQRSLRVLRNHICVAIRQSR
jgi:serine/threonine protein kinase